MGLGDISVLIVDDSQAICEVLSAMLKDYNVNSVDYCQDGETALKKIEKDSMAYDAIFIDLHMEGMDGLELMQNLHTLKYRGGVIVMSALERRILDFTLEVISNYNLRVLGSIEKPLEKTLIAFMTKRIRNFYPIVKRQDKILKRREVYEAIQRKNVVSYYQPKISSVNNSIVGLESLVRLDLPGRGIVSPAAFLPVAEKFDLIEPLMEAMLNVSFPEFSNFIQDKIGSCTLSINISPMQLYNDSLPERLISHLNKSSIPRDRLMVEITENHAIRDDQQLKNLNRLRIHGFNLSLDDYGAGYTNLRQLKSMPFNEIKLDAQLVQGIHLDKVLRVIVESVRKVTQELGLTLIAEGISDPKDLIELNKVGVDAYQGFLFCRPKPMDELMRWFGSWEKIQEQSGLRNNVHPITKP